MSEVSSKMAVEGFSGGRFINRVDSGDETLMKINELMNNWWLWL